MSETAYEDRLLQAAQRGEADALGQLFAMHRDRLTRMVTLRMDDRVKKRADASDVIQETYLEATRRLKEFFNQPDVSFFIWLRFLASQRLVQLHRFHLSTKARDARKDVSIEQGGMPAVTSGVLAAKLVGNLTSPSVAAHKAELRKRVHGVLDSMSPIDREILTLRHFEQLSNLEAAKVMEISPAAAGDAYIRALVCLRSVLDAYGLQ